MKQAADTDDYYTFIENIRDIAETALCNIFPLTNAFKIKLINANLVAHTYPQFIIKETDNIWIVLYSLYMNMHFKSTFSQCESYCCI